MSTSDKKTHEERSNNSIMILGTRKPSKVGNSWKISIPKLVAHKWRLDEESEGGAEDKDAELYTYVITYRGKKCLAITNSPLPGDPILDDEGWE